MLELTAKTFVFVLAGYCVVGLAFAIIFVSWGVQKLDSEAQGTKLGFRLLILPGVAASWPMFLKRWVKGLGEPPTEVNPHR